MSKTLRQRQADWRGRRDLKSALFDILNAERVRGLQMRRPDDDRPEMKAIVDFFLAYPRCHNWPEELLLRNGVWCLYMAPQGDYIEDAAAFVALSQVTSLPIISGRVERRPFDPQSIDLVKREVAELRRLNLWGTL